jgi:hypothetical protein
MIGVVRIDPDLMIVDVFDFIEMPQRFPPSSETMENVHYINAIEVLWIGDDPRIVHRGHIVFVSPFPAATAIVRAKDAAFLSAASTVA